MIFALTPIMEGWMDSKSSTGRGSLGIMRKSILATIFLALTLSGSATAQSEKANPSQQQSVRQERQKLWKQFHAAKTAQQRKAILGKIIQLSYKAKVRPKRPSQTKPPVRQTGSSEEESTPSTSENRANTSSPPRLSTQLETLAKDLYYISESDYPYKKFHRAMKPQTPLTAENFRKLMRLDESVEIRVEPASSFFSDPPIFEESEKARYAKIEAFMKANLTDIQVINVGGEDVVEGEVYIIGRAADGSLVGLKTKRIWT